MPQENLPMFFKWMAPGFRTQLSLPPVISEKLIMAVKEERRGAKLISKKGMSDVDIHKSENGGFSFTRGWKEFVEEHDLRLGDFLVFEDMGNLIFKVTLFDPTCCEKGFHVHQERENNDPNVKAKKGDEENGAQRQNLNTTNYVKRKPKAGNGVKHQRVDDQKRDTKSRRLRESIGDPTKKRQFSSTMKPYNILRNTPFLYIPSAFCKANGLPKKARVTLKGPSGEEHQGGLTVYERRHDGCIHAEAWSGFVASNDLKVGDTCVFKLRDNTPNANGIVFDVEVHAAAP